jgi:RHS repeat-associated protein
VGGTEGGDRLAGCLPAVDQVTPKRLRLEVAASAAIHGGGFLVALVAGKTAIVPDDARRPGTGRLQYNSGLDTSISRLSFLANDNLGQVGTHLEEYSYLGLNTVVKRAHPEPGIDLTYIAQPGDAICIAPCDPGDQYTGLDRFGRVVDQRWVPTSSPQNPTDRFQYTYDQDSNRLTRTNAVNSNFNESYSYDNFNQLTSFTRGSHSQTWTLEPLGNWQTLVTDNGTLHPQTRTNDTQNRILTLTDLRQPTLVAPTYDNNGNTIHDQLGSTLTYDAWNRPVQYSGGISVSYAYDALGRRLVENSGTRRDLYYSSAWQVVEERVGNNPQNQAVQIQNVWSPVYVDALIERDRDPNQSGMLSERLYVQQDANWNVTALVDSTGAVQERYVYDPYGTPTKLKADWTAQTSNLFNWAYLHQGGRLDGTSGLYNFRMRDYSPTLGRWIQQDPIKYRGGGANLYEDAAASPTTYCDASGLEVTVCARPVRPGGVIQDQLGPQHSFILIIPDDPASLPKPIRDELKELGDAGSGLILTGRGDAQGNLKPELNYQYDIDELKAGTVEFIKLKVPEGKTDTELIKELFKYYKQKEAAYNSGNTTPYDRFNSNCHTWVNGAVQSTGAQKENPIPIAKPKPWVNWAVAISPLWAVDWVAGVVPQLPWQDIGPVLPHPVGPPLPPPRR